MLGLGLVGKIWLHLLSICYSREKEKAGKLSSEGNKGAYLFGDEDPRTCGPGEQSWVEMCCACKGTSKKGGARCQR